MKIRHHIVSLVFLLIVFSAASTFAQTGNYFINNFTPAKMSGASPQNWAITQDKYNRILVANSSGIYLNDGKSWTLHQLRNNALASAIITNNTGNIFVGGEHEFGSLIKDDKGKLKYHSLSSRLKDRDDEFTFIRSVQVLHDQVFFQANEKLFVYQNDRIKVLDPDSDIFHTAFIVGNHYLIRERGMGFKFYEKGELKFIPNSSILKDIRVYSITHLKENIYQLASREEGLFLMEYNQDHPELSSFSKLNSQIDNWLIENEVYCGSKLDNKHFAFGSLQDGIIIVDDEYNIIKRISSNNGLQEDGVKQIYSDNNGNIWLALSNGVSFLEYNSAITDWSKGQGVKGGVQTVAKFQGDLFIGNDKGLQVLNKENNSFISLDFFEETWDLLPFEDELLIASSIGLHSYSKGKITTVLDYQVGFFKIFYDNNKPTLFYLGSEFGIIVGRYENHHFTITREETENVGSVRSIASNGNGMVLFGTTNNGVFYLDYKNGITLKSLKQVQGLNNPTENHVFSYQNHLLVATDFGIMKILDKENRVSAFKAPEFNPFTTRTIIAKAHQVGDEIWFEGVSEDRAKKKIDEIGVLSPKGKSFNIEFKMLKRVRDKSIHQFYVNDNKVYLATNDGLICYNNGYEDGKRDLQTYVSRIVAKEDTVFHNIEAQSHIPELKLLYENNSPVFSFGASDYVNSEDLEFSYFLEGSDKEFSDWKKEREKEFSNLSEGSYVLHVKSRNILGDIGTEVIIPFSVSPPWYRSIVAYIFYFILFIVAVFIIVKLNTKRLKDQNIKLEKIITIRTKTIEHQKTEIEHKNQEITDSINYAKRIQDAILPPMEEILTVWKETFIYFQPKDIVSGDFYWYNKVSDHEFLIGCADCTGHGVPGGFMSMICSDKLSEGAKASSHPKEILFHANNAVKTALRQSQSEGSTKDGMEISVVRFNTKTGSLSYSGANRPLWIVRHNTKEVEEHKADKASSTEYNFEYKQHDLKLEKGDRVYLTSDGYPNQYGGPDGKKFMSKNMKNYLLTIKDLPAVEQSKLLKDNINGWMNDSHEQVDDLLVIGIAY